MKWFEKESGLSDLSKVETGVSHPSLLVNANTDETRLSRSRKENIVGVKKVKVIVQWLGLSWIVWANATTENMPKGMARIFSNFHGDYAKDVTVEDLDKAIENDAPFEMI